MGAGGTAIDWVGGVGTETAEEGECTCDKVAVEEGVEPVCSGCSR